ncbi:MAG: hypothetical protein NT003_04525, partial [Candidatus Magasanikbacteria bacterium]|nr:hypothetical protein [Candidatus Magasanikbacteria bacterium]
MFQNPFLQPLTPRGATNLDKDEEMLAEIVGPKDAKMYRDLVADELRKPRATRPDLKKLADAALASQPDLLAASAEKQAEQFLTTEIKLKFNKQAESLLATNLLETNERGETGVTGIDENFYELPTPEQITAYFTAPERKAFIEQKVGQGFTRLLITP